MLQERRDDACLHDLEGGLSNDDLDAQLEILDSLHFLDSRFRRLFELESHVHAAPKVSETSKKNSSSFVFRNEDYRMEQGELQVPQYATNLGFGIRFLYLVIGMAALSALLLLPSRRVHNMYIHIPDKSLIIESGRLFGTKPTYYIFDGKVSYAPFCLFFNFFAGKRTSSIHSSKIAAKKRQHERSEHGQNLKWHAFLSPETRLLGPDAEILSKILISWQRRVSVEYERN